MDLLGLWKDAFLVTRITLNVLELLEFGGPLEDAEPPLLDETVLMGELEEDQEF